MNLVIEFAPLVPNYVSDLQYYGCKLVIFLPLKLVGGSQYRARCQSDYKKRNLSVKFDHVDNDNDK